MKKRRQQHLIQYLNFISAHSNSEKVKLENLDFSQFSNLLSKATYENMCEFNTQHRHCYCTKSILEELGVHVKKQIKEIYSKEFIKEIKSYRDFITNPYNIDIEKRYIQREDTFDIITERAVKKFADYLHDEKNIDYYEIKSLLPFIQSDFLDYTFNLLKKYQTETYIVRTRFIAGYINFISVHKELSENEKGSLLTIVEKYKKIRRQSRLQDGYRAKNKEEKQKTKLKTIIKAIKKLSKEYKKTQNIIYLKSKLILKILVHLGWRAKNIINLRMNKTIYKKGKKWYYSFPPELQKSPFRNGNKLITITGIFPIVLQKDLSEYIKITKANDYLFITQRNNPYINNSFSNYVKNITEKHIGIKLNPHIFRDIVFSYLLDNDFDLIKAELFIWHKPSISKTDRHYFKIDINKAVLQVNKELMKLYEYRRKPKTITSENVIQFKKG